jgi:hypothetical protein
MIVEALTAERIIPWVALIALYPHNPASWRVALTGVN